MFQLFDSGIDIQKVSGSPLEDIVRTDMCEQIAYWPVFLKVLSIY